MTTPTQIIWQLAGCPATQADTDARGGGAAAGVLVVDPYAGSGTTMIACDSLGLPSFSVELRPEYAELALGRAKRAGIVVR